MESGAIIGWWKQQKRSGTYRTIQAANEGGGVSPILTAEEREELESREVNLYCEIQMFGRNV
jgi:hypothetical protein